MTSYPVPFVLGKLLLKRLTNTLCIHTVIELTMVLWINFLTCATNPHITYAVYGTLIPTYCCQLLKTVQLQSAV